ncbi:uncharacterized protein LOC122391358 [Amphibalanus amphitrite]|uniref:uncharacterized protein LOC122391358 n=1 Tax=Amphibalanus amphitrite TaxID=1232801 RepID=UPI001C9226B1|nr:uncharacterized protein LOC122391358 [Amphibalanus amphitrite]
MQVLLPLLVALALCAELRAQFWPGAVVGAGIALESAGIGYIAGRASRRHHHHHHHRGYYGRRRRAAGLISPVPTAAELSAGGPSVDEDPALTAALEAAELDAYFRVIAAEDLLDCGLRLVCELGAEEELGRMDERQRNVIALFRSEVATLGSTMSPARQRYVSAFHRGQSSGEAERCGEMFPLCPASGQEIMAALRTVSR